VGYVGFSDGWQDLFQHNEMQWEYARAENGNIALTAEIDMTGSAEFTLSLAFAPAATEAGQHARASLLQGFDVTRKNFVAPWENWHKTLLPMDRPGQNSYRTGAAVLRIHEAKQAQGGIIASLSIPWGFSKGDEDLGGYHLIWPRDLVETAGGLLAAGAADLALRVLLFLRVTQEWDGHWPQNMWLDGQAYWNGVQMDEAAFPILLIGLLLREKKLDAAELAGLLPMVRRAASYIVCNGPVTGQDRWEEDSGYSPFTLAVEIAALVVGAEIAESQGEHDIAKYLLEIADTWNDSIERWTYVNGSKFGESFGVDGYYIRIAPVEESTASSPLGGFVPIKNRPPGQSQQPTSDLISTDFLALVRFGLRAANDPRIVNTVKVVDALLRTDTPQGAVWHRYNYDGYGEHENGSPFDGTGTGRAWPLLTGERALYELAAGNNKGAEDLLQTLEDCASAGGLIPEQVWDATDLPQLELFYGRPTGSARPLVWAHAELIKLVRSLRDGRVFDQPEQTTARYLEQTTRSAFSLWSCNNKARAFYSGTTLRISLTEPSLIHWSIDGWTTTTDTETVPTGLGTHIADLGTKQLPIGSTVTFTIYWSNRRLWDDQNYSAMAVGRND
jgi:glucoamylase